MATFHCQICDVELLFKENGVWNAKSSSLSEVERMATASEDAYILFASANEIRKCTSCRPRLSTLLCIPTVFWSTYYRRSNGYFGSCETYSSDNTLESYCTWFRFIVKQMLVHAGPDKKDYLWHKMNIFTRWWPSGRNIIICFDPTPELRMQFPVPILNSPGTCVQNPFWIHEQFVEELLKLHDNSVWSIRDLVRDAEMARTPTVLLPNPDYYRLHEIARHAGHSTETLNVAVNTLETILLQHENFIREHCRETPPNIQTNHRHTRNRLVYQLQMLNSLLHRSVANKERLQSEITLAFNTVAQYDSKVSVKIAWAAQSDSAAMKTIAFVTTMFLPPTFICAIFSMSFFNFNPGDETSAAKWTVSEKWWIYCATAIPFTGTTMIVLGLLWRRSLAIQST